MYNMCREASDCGAKYCCAMKGMNGKYGFCMPAKGLGEQCSNSYLVRSYICNNGIDW